MSNSIELFNTGNFEESIKACLKNIESDVDCTQNKYIAGIACLNIGDFQRATEFLEKVPPVNSEIDSVKKYAAESIQTQNRLPRAWFQKNPSSFFAGLTCLRIGGSVKIIDYVLRDAKEIIDLNAAPLRFGQDNCANVIRDAHDLSPIADNSIDFIASSHTIEHLVNPLLALKEWVRVLKPGGTMYSVIPNYRNTFDHKREPTSLEHLVEDLREGNTSSDWFHICEFLRNYDCEKDFVFKGDKDKHFEEFIQAPNLRTHYHVFDLPLCYSMHEYIGLRTSACFEADISIHWCGTKPAECQEYLDTIK